MDKLLSSNFAQKAITVQKRGEKLSDKRGGDKAVMGGANSRENLIQALVPIRILGYNDNPNQIPFTRGFASLIRDQIPPTTIAPTPR